MVKKRRENQVSMERKEAKTERSGRAGKKRHSTVLKPGHRARNDGRHGGHARWIITLLGRQAEPIDLIHHGLEGGVELRHRLGWRSGDQHRGPTPCSPGAGASRRGAAWRRAWGLGRWPGGTRTDVMGIACPGRVSMVVEALVRVPCPVGIKSQRDGGSPVERVVEDMVEEIHGGGNGGGAVDRSRRDCRRVECHA